MNKKLAELANKKHTGEIQKVLVGTGFLLDKQWSDRQHKVFYNPTIKKPMVSYRETDTRDCLGMLGELRNSSERQLKSTRRKGICWIQQVTVLVELEQRTWNNDFPNDLMKTLLTVDGRVS